MTSMRLLALFATLLVLAAGPAPAAGEPDLSNVVHAELLPGWRMPDGHRMAALKLTLAPGWHTYWRAPGEAGVPPRFDWAGSANLGSVRVLWPVPRVFDLGGLRAIGYEDGVVLPLELTPKDPGKPIALSAKIDLGVCRDICVPVALDASADLTGAGAKDPAITRALSDTPQSAAKAGLSHATCHVAPTSDGLRLTATLDLPPLGGNEVTVMELPDPSVWVSEAATTRKGGTLTAVADIVPAGGQPFALDRSALTITVLGKGRAVELHGCEG